MWSAAARRRFSWARLASPDPTPTAHECSTRGQARAANSGGKPPHSTSYDGAATEAAP